MEKKDVDNRPVAGSFMFEKADCTCFLLGKKESGKTQLIYNIIQHRIQKNTTVVIFCATVYADDAWKGILEWLEKKSVAHIIHTSIYDKNGNALQELVDELEDEYREKYYDEKEKKKEKKTKHKEEFDINKVINPEKEEKKERKPKLKAPDWLIIIDDLADEISDRSLPTLIKKHRHYKTQLLISNQTLNDLPLSGRKNLDYWMMFGGLDSLKLREIYDRCTLQIDYQQFEDLYYDATRKPYNFFYFCSYKNDFRRNFNTAYIVTTFAEKKNIDPNNIDV
jgi:hypothetical protein